VLGFDEENSSTLCQQNRNSSNRDSSGTGPMQPQGLWADLGLCTLASHCLLPSHCIT
jgi:hypothetical protein